MTMTAAYAGKLAKAFLLPSKALVSIEKRCLLLDSTLGHTTLLYLVTPATAFESDTFAEIPKLLP